MHAAICILPPIDERLRLSRVNESPDAAAEAGAESRRRYSAVLARETGKVDRFSDLIAEQTFGQRLRSIDDASEAVEIAVGKCLPCGRHDREALLEELIQAVHEIASIVERRAQ